MSFTALLKEQSGFIFMAKNLKDDQRHQNYEEL
jgi:hypothetical protein